jgi:hypothetical protein
MKTSIAIPKIPHTAAKAKGKGSWARLREIFAESARNQGKNTHQINYEMQAYLKKLRSEE